jgi:predicted PurR-regulated permease PerM
MLPIGVLALYALAHAAGVVLLLFIVAAVIALILNPLVSLLQRAHLPRTLAVIAVYASFFTMLPLLGFALAGPVADQATSFANDAPSLIDDANTTLDDIQQFFDDNGIGIRIKGQGDSALSTLQDQLVKGSGQIVSVTGELLRRLVELSFFVILVFVLSIYMLIYAPEIGRLVRKSMPPGDGTPQDDFPTRVQRAVSGYVRGQLLFSAIMGTSAGLALWIFGVAGIFPDGRTYAPAFGAWFGIMELVPYVGPILGALPPIVVALVQDPLTAVWVALLFVGLQQLEGHVVAPNVFGHALRLNPLLVIFALLLGGEIYGLIGALIALPIAAVVRETAVYLSKHLVFEPWGAGFPLTVTSAAGEGGAAPGIAEAEAEAEPAPEPGPVAGAEAVAQAEPAPRRPAPEPEPVAGAEAVAQAEREPRPVKPLRR